MYTAIAAFAIAFGLSVVEVFFGAPNLLKKYFDWADEKRYGGKSAYRACMYTYPLIIVALFYGLGTVAGFYFGFAAAWADVGCFFVLLFFSGYIWSFCSFGKNVSDIAVSAVFNKPRPRASQIRQGSAILFVAGGFGSGVMLALHLAGVFAN